MWWIHLWCVTCDELFCDVLSLHLCVMWWIDLWCVESPSLSLSDADELVRDTLNLSLSPRIALHCRRALERRQWLASRSDCFICFPFVYFKGQSQLVVVLTVESCAYHYRQPTRVTMGFWNRQCFAHFVVIHYYTRISDCIFVYILHNFLTHYYSWRVGDVIVRYTMHIAPTVAAYSMSLTDEKRQRWSVLLFFRSACAPLFTHVGACRTVRRIRPQVWTWHLKAPASFVLLQYCGSTSSTCRRYASPVSSRFWSK
jgi:hypothetical protein